MNATAFLSVHQKFLPFFQVFFSRVEVVLGGVSSPAYLISAATASPICVFLTAMMTVAPSPASAAAVSLQIPLFWSERRDFGLARRSKE